MRYRVLGVIVVAALAGCGGSDSEDGESRTTAPPQPTSAKFVRQVDALCKDTRPALARAATALTKARDARRAGRASVSRTFDVFAIQLRKATAATERFLARLRAMAVPEPEKPFHGSVIDSVGKGLANLGEQTSAAEAQDAIRLRELSIAGSVINARTKGLFTGHGDFRHCGRR